MNTSSENESKKIIVYKIYVEGSGANDMKEAWTGFSARGLGFGVSKTGVVALVSKAVSAVDSRLSFFKTCKKVNLHFDVFGFSRGAACARLFSYLIKRGKTDILDREIEFAKYYCKHLYKEIEVGSKKMKKLCFLDDYSYKSSGNESKTKEVCFLGIFDTVVSIGMLRRKKNTDLDNSSNKFWDKNNTINPLRVAFVEKDFKGNLHDLNAKEYGMYSPQLGVPTFHICAMDEFRENFALTDVGEQVPKNSLEIFLPGCHSDIGGGYICNNEEKIVLNKYPTFSLEGIPLIKPLKGCAHIFISNPHCERGEHEPIGLSSMRKLGWLPYKEEITNQPIWKFWKKFTPLLHNKAETQFNKTSEQKKNSTQGESEDNGALNNEIKYSVQGESKNNGSFEKEGKIGKYEWWDRGDKIGWKRTVPSFFSNVPLHLMAERASVITKRSLFLDGGGYEKGSFWEKGYYDIPKELQEFYDDVKKKVNIESDNGCRKWIFPDDDYSSEKYRKLRLFHLHFTSEQKLGVSRLWDVQNATKVGDYYNVISRIVYHGNKEDSGNMHYMFNYNSYYYDDVTLC